MIKQQRPCFVATLLDDHNVDGKFSEVEAVYCAAMLMLMFSSSDQVILSVKVSDEYEKLAESMANNKLVINADMTHLIVMASSSMPVLF